MSVWEAIKNLFASTPLPRRLTFTCPCCGYISLTSRGGFEICAMCFWEDDGHETEEYWREIPCGPNRVSLREAQKNFLRFGACDEHGLSCVQEYRHEQHGLKKDPNFTLLPDVDLTGMEPYEDMTNARLVTVNEGTDHEDSFLVGTWKWRPTTFSSASSSPNSLPFHPVKLNNPASLK